MEEIDFIYPTSLRNKMSRYFIDIYHYHYYFITFWWKIKECHHHECMWLSSSDDTYSKCVSHFFGLQYGWMYTRKHACTILGMFLVKFLIFSQLILIVFINSSFQFFSITCIGNMTPHPTPHPPREYWLQNITLSFYWYLNFNRKMHCLNMYCQWVYL